MVDGRSMKASVAVAAAIVAATVGAPWPAHADDPSTWGLNGTYEASSNGEWAKTNDRYQKEAVVRSTWTISTQCTSPVDCAGTVTSDQGWTAPIYTTTGVWWIKRTLVGWQPCPDGTAADALQTYRIFATERATGSASLFDSSLLTGEDHTVGNSGNCGRSEWVDIRMPFTAVKVS
jgi:hypothetical protein